MKKTIYSLFTGFALLSSISLVGCGANKTEATSGTPTTQKQIVVGLIEPVANLEWFKTVQMGVDAASNDLGHGNIKVLTGNSQSSPDTEANLIENYISRKVDAILIAPTDSKASVAAIKEAKDKGIKVVIWDTTLDSDVMDNYVGTDNTELGAQAGRYVLDYINKNLGGKANIVIMSLPKYEVGVERTNGFKQAISSDPNIKVVAEQDGENPDAAAVACETILRAHPDVNLIWAANEGGVDGALVATGDQTKIKIVGTDMSLNVANKLLQNNNGLLAISTQDPYNIGYKSLSDAIDMIKGQPVPSDSDKTYEGHTLQFRQLIPLDMYTKDNPQKTQEYLTKYNALASKSN